MTMDFQGRTRLTIRRAFIATSPFRCGMTTRFQLAMHIPSIKHRLEQGSTLLTVVIIGGIICSCIGSMLVLSSNSVSNASRRVDWNKAFFNTENAVVWMAQTAFDQAPRPVPATTTRPHSGPCHLEKSFRPLMEMSTSQAHG